MTSYAWHYELLDGTKGNVGGADLKDKEDAEVQLAFQYGARARGMKLRRIGEDYESSEISAFGREDIDTSAR